MARHLLPVLLVLLPALAISGAPTAASPVRHAISVTVRQGGARFRATLDPNRDPTLTFSRAGHVIWSGVPRAWHPWKMQVVDITGNGDQEVAVGVNKPTKFLPFPHNCLFLYRWNGREELPMWLGSSLSKPFTDFLFAPRRGRPARLYSVERLSTGRYCVCIYHWDNFGFTFDGQAGSWPNAKLLDARTDRVRVDAGGKIVVLKSSDFKTL